MDKIRRFFECFVPITACNLRCDYCYVIQEKRKLGQVAGFTYSPEHIAMALSKERLGGVCYFSICGAGETLMMPGLSEVVAALLQEGHYVNITTNGTFTSGFRKLLNIITTPAVCQGSPVAIPSAVTGTNPLSNHLHFAFSLHFLELERKGLLGRFAENVNSIRAAGCSFVIQMNLYDGYAERLDEIKRYCMDNFGAYPQLAATRLELGNRIELHTRHTEKEYRDMGGTFNSPLFDFTMRNFNVRRHEFCYAGDWSACLELTGGWMKKCYGDRKAVNIYDDIDKPIPFEAFGSHCRSLYCVNSSHFLSLGVIPELYRDVSYAGLRNREEAHWYNDEMREFLSGKLVETNSLYPVWRRMWIDIKEPFRLYGTRLRNKIKRMLKK